MTQPTQEQLDALKRFQDKVGHHWKAELRVLWEQGYPQDFEDAGLLQQLRNNLGPRWLTAYRPGEKRVGFLQQQVVEGTTVKAFWGRPLWLLVDVAGNQLDTVQGLSKSDARRVAKNNRITLIEDVT